MKCLNNKDTRRQLCWVQCTYKKYSYILYQVPSHLALKPLSLSLILYLIASVCLITFKFISWLWVTARCMYWVERMQGLLPLCELIVSIFASLRTTLNFHSNPLSTIFSPSTTMKKPIWPVMVHYYHKSYVHNLRQWHEVIAQVNQVKDIETVISHIFTSTLWNAKLAIDMSRERWYTFAQEKKPEVYELM